MLISVTNQRGYWRWFLQANRQKSQSSSVQTRTSWGPSWRKEKKPCCWGPMLQTVPVCLDSSCVSWCRWSCSADSRFLWALILKSNWSLRRKLKFRTLAPLSRRWRQSTWLLEAKVAGFESQLGLRFHLFRLWDPSEALQSFKDLPFCLIIGSYWCLLKFDCSPTPLWQAHSWYRWYFWNIHCRSQC